jgi:hypothetical protein
MTRTKNVLATIAFVIIVCAVYASTGPWKTKDEQQYDQLSAMVLKVELQHSSPIEPEVIAGCLRKLPPTVLNLRRLFAGPGITLANPIQPMLVSIMTQNGGSMVTVRRPSNLPLRSPHRAAIMGCLV